MATANFYIRPEDGWVEVVPDGSTFVKIRSNTCKHAFFVTSGDVPADTDIGYKVDKYDCFFVDVPADGAYYLRVLENLPAETRFDVFYITS